MNEPHKPKVTLLIIRRILIFSVIAGAIFVGGYAAGRSGLEAEMRGYPKVTISRETPPQKELDFSMFWSVWDYVEASYFSKDNIVPAKMVYGAIKGMVAAVGDPYSVFLDPKENEITSEDLDGNFDGIGVQIGYRGTQLAVMAPLPGSPAEKAGIKGGDYIVGIKDDEKQIDRGTVGITIPEAVQYIRGKAGSTVTLAIVREGVDDPMVVDIVREKIDVPSVTLSFTQDPEKVAHIRLLKFGGDTSKEWDEAVLSILKEPNVDGVVLDLRNNPGGYLQGAVSIGAEFLDQGDVVVIEERAGGRQQHYKTDRLGRLTNMPLIVLVNKGSASASEILAGALRDQNGILLVGDTTFGKGTIQEREELEGGVALHLTTARWLTPKETWVNDVGLTPDVKVEDNTETQEDEQLQKAIELVKTL